MNEHHVKHSIHRSGLTIAAAMVIVCGIAGTASAQGTVFTYQGTLTQNGQFAHGSYDFEFNLYDDADPASGTWFGDVRVLTQPVVNGIFTCTLDFGPGVFDGSARWLQIRVRPAGSGVYSELTPLQPITAAPHALYSAESAMAATATTADTAMSADSATTAATADDSDTLDGLDSTAFVSAAGDTISGDLTVTGSAVAATLCIGADCRTEWPSAGGSSPWTISGNDIYSSNSGNVGVGETTPAEKLHVAGNIRLGVDSSISFNNANTRIYQSSPNLKLYAHENDSADIELDAADNIEIEADDDIWLIADDDVEIAPGNDLKIDADVIEMEGPLSLADSTPDTTPDFTLEVEGDAGKSVGGTSWAVAADRRFKTIEGPISDALDLLGDLEPISYTWNDQWEGHFESAEPGRHYGFIAEDLEKVIPEFVSIDDEGYYWYNPSGIEAILVAAFQTQQKEIINLNDRIEALEQQIEALRVAVAPK